MEKAKILILECHSLSLVFYFLFCSRELVTQQSRRPKEKTSGFRWQLESDRFAMLNLEEQNGRKLLSPCWKTSMQFLGLFSLPGCRKTSCVPGWQKKGGETAPPLLCCDDYIVDVEPPLLPQPPKNGSVHSRTSQEVIVRFLEIRGDCWLI